MSHRSTARLILVLVAVLAGALAPPAQGQAAYTIPSDNPFVGTPGARGEIYVYGMRNPYRWSFDRANGDMWIGDVGGSSATNDFEEIDHLAAGGIGGVNLGWHCLSGNASNNPPAACTPANYRAPLYTYPSGADVVIGGYVVRDPSLPAFAGRYLFGQFTTGVRRLEPNGTATTLAGLSGLSGFGEDGAGHLYVTSLDGPVDRLTQNGSALALSSIGNFTQPLAVAAAPGDTNRLFIVEKTGHVMIRQGGVVSQYLDLTSLVTTAGGEQGLLAFAVAPDYATSGRVFAYYTNKSNDLQLDEFRRTGEGPDRSDVATRRPVLTIQHDQAQNHNGGQLLFGPDRRLYLSTGDGGTQDDPENDAQSLGSLLGKILRIDVGVPQPPGDTTAPRLRTLVKHRQRVLRLRGAIAYVRCDEACGLVAGGRLRIGRHLYKLRRVNALITPDKRVRVKVTLGPKARRRLARALKRHRHPTVRLNLRALDSAGNRSALATRSVRVRR
jgi:glucose/arabinose dehydrogenase